MKVCSGARLQLSSVRFLALFLGLGIPVLVSGCGGGGSSSSGSVGSGGSGGGGNTTPPPTISSISPTSVSAGSNALTLTVSGSGFLSTSVVQVNSISESTTFVSSTELTATVPASQLVSGADLTVVVSNGSLTSGSGTPVNLEVDNPAPAITSVSPTSEPAGTTSPNITVTGTGFVPTTVINVNGATRTTTFTSSTQISVTLSAADVSTAGSLSLTAVNSKPGGGTSTATTVAIVAPNPVPTVSTLDPATELVGTESANVVVAGTGFVSSTVINVNGSARPTSFTNSTQVSVTLTAADLSATGSLSVTAVNPAPGGGMSAAITLPVNNPPVGPIQINPSMVAVGSASPTTITVTGNTFVSNSAVKVNGNARSTTYVNSTTLNFIATVADQADSGILAVTVTNPPPGGGTSPTANLTIGSGTPTPIITSVSPNSITAGSPDTTITVLGTGFTSSSVVQWNGANLNTSVANGNGAISLQATVPAADLASEGAATVKVDTPTAAPSLSNALTVNITNPAAPTLTAISPNAGPINTATAITLSGTGFTSQSTVALNGATIASDFVSSTELTTSIPAAAVATPGNVSITVTTPAPGGGTSAAAVYTAYIGIPNNAMVYNSVNGLLYVSVPSSAGPPYANSVVSVDPVTGALGRPILIGSEPDQLAVSSDGTTLWVGLDGASAVRKVDLTTATAGMQFSLGNNSGIYAYPPIAHALGVLPGSPNSIVMSSALNQYIYEDMLGIYDSGVPRSDFVDLSTISSLPAIFLSSTKTEVYATSYESGYQVLSYDSNGLKNLAGNTGTDNFGGVYGTAVQVDNGVAYLDSGVALNAETGALLGTFYSGGTTVATGPMVSDSSLGKLFILENVNSNNTSTPALIQTFNESNFTPIPSAILQVNGALAGTKYGAGNSTATELNGNNSVNTMVRWGADGLVFRAANGVFSFRTGIVKDLSAVSADLGVSIVPSGSSKTGANTTYTATIRNTGPSASSNIALTVAVPSTGVLLSATPSTGSCSTSGAVSCDLGGLSSGSSVSVSFVVSQMTAGTSTLHVQVAGSENDPNLANNQASSSVTISGNAYNPAPAIVSITPAAILAGSSATEITITGSGFTSESSIVVGGAFLSTTELSSTQLTAVVPATVLTNLGWTTVSVSTPAPGGGNSAALPLTIFSVISMDANHILYDPYSRKIMASIGSDSTSITGNSIVAITPDTATVGTAIPIGSQPTNLALTSDGQVLYTVLVGSQSVSRFNMLTQTPEYTYAIQPGSGTDTSPAPRGIATQPGNEDTVAIDLGSWAGNAIYEFDPTNKTAAMVGQASGPYSGSCITFLDAGDMLAFDTDTSGATLDHYTVTSAGFTYYDYSQYGESTLNGFGCFKLSGGLAFGNAGGVANPATAPATQIGIFPVSGGGEFTTNAALAPDTSLQSVFFAVNTEDEGTSSSGAAVDGVESFNQNTFLPRGSLSLNMESIEGNTSYTAVDLIRWGQDGLAVLTSGGHLYLLRGAFVVPQLLTASTSAALTSSSFSTIAHGSGNTLLTLTGSNFVPGVAVTWNGSYRTTTIVDATHITVAIPASDLVSTGTASLVATNPGGPPSTALQITIN